MTQALKAQIIPTTMPTKTKVHRQPLNSVSTLSSNDAHRTADTTIALKRAAKTKVPPSTTLLSRRTTAAAPSPCSLALVPARSSFTGDGPEDNSDPDESVFRHGSDPQEHVKGRLRLRKATRKRT